VTQVTDFEPLLETEEPLSPHSPFKGGGRFEIDAQRLQ